MLDQTWHRRALVESIRRMTTQMATEYDAVIVGLGPAGASAATALAKAGYRVFAIDRKPAPGTPVQCAEFVPMMMGNETKMAVTASVQPIADMFTFVEQEAPDQACNFSGRMIDRKAFDAGLVAEAETAGARCHFASNLEAISQDGIITCGGKSFRPKIIIGADGPHSSIGAAIGSINKDVLETRQITVPLLKPHQGTDIFLSADYPGGYGWLFPKGDKANIGLGLDHDQRDQLKPLLEDLHQRLMDEARVGSEISYHTGGAIPAGGLLKPQGRLGESLALLAGDAAGLTNCITGAGIAAAIISGKLAAEAAIAFLEGDKDAAEDYAEDLQDMFGAALTRACQHRQKLKTIRQSKHTPSPAHLRNSWIAYPQYWH